jgi:hypothetical protein
VCFSSLREHDEKRVGRLLGVVDGEGRAGVREERRSASNGEREMPERSRESVGSIRRRADNLVRVEVAPELGGAAGTVA